MLKVFGLIVGGRVEDVIAAHRRSTVRRPHVRGFVVSEVVDHLQGELQADMFIEAWWDDEAIATDYAGAETALVPVWALPDGVDGTWWLTTEHVYKTPVYDGSPGDRLKLIGTAYRRDDFTTRAFFDYWRDIHGPISGRAPGLGSYVVSEIIQRLAGNVEADGFVEQWWPDRATLDIASTSPEVAIAWEDVHAYAKPTGTFWVTREHVEIAPPYVGPGYLER